MPAYAQTSPAPFALSRTCAFEDFPGCITVASWQQCLADHAWATWLAQASDPSPEPSVVVNGSGVAFLAPGPPAIVVTPDGWPPVEAPALFALCVLDHIEAPGRFLLHAQDILQPRGLLFLTFAYWDAEGPDTAKGHDGRTRIYSAHSYQRLIRDARRLGFENFGGTDWRYHGNVLDDHSLASLVLQRREA